ncbi:MAG TPA: methyltransferase domain-containing protein [Acidimicrobiales bacterium]|nr:methyltransferase domain-containing protein [Acidimicrobiales bacterium]
MTTPGRRSWDGDAYHRLSAPMEAMAMPVLARLSLCGGETVLDAGCGSGRVTHHLLDALPEGRVIAVDADADMVRAAAVSLAGTRAAVREADLLELDLRALEVGVDAVDAVFSTATFHWIRDHDALFARLFSALVPGGRLEAQCGGGNNIARVHAVARDVARQEHYAQDLYDVEAVTNFYTPEETEQRLRNAGFAEVRCWLQDIPVTPEDPVGYLRTIILGQHVERLGEDLGMAFVHEVAEGLGYPGAVTLDYVRLNISAVRP